MPSGFQQDQNQLTPAFFRVVINMNNTDDDQAWWNQSDNDGATTTGRITTFAWDEAAFPDRLPQTQEIADALARGNLRFQRIVDMLGLFADCQILDIENWGDDNAEDQVNQDQIAFTVKYDRNEFLFPAFQKYAEANGYGLTGGTETIDDVTYPTYYSDFDEYYIDSQEDVVKELVTIGAAGNNYRKSVRVFAPEEEADPMTGEGLQKVIEIDRPADSSNYIFRNVTVTNVNGTDTTISYD
jgi:hypothetical protein